MTITAKNVAEYIEQIPDNQKELFLSILNIIRKNIPQGFEECINYKMPSWVVPHSLYGSGYHCDPKLPLPFLAVGIQKNSVNLYHMGIYADTELYNWFINEYDNLDLKKLDIGKSCMRFKKIEEFPKNLVGDLIQKTNPTDWINIYEKAFKNPKKG